VPPLARTSLGPPRWGVRWRPGARVAVALLVSLLAHAALIGVWLGFHLWQSWPSGPVTVEVVGTTVVTDLPLGEAAPPRHEPPQADVAPPRAARPKGAKPADKGETASPKGDERVTWARPESLGQYAPEGSRLTALLRVDRLRGTPFAPAVDSILLNLPDRQHLLEGTDLDLYRDFEALLIATPNPLDATVTFLAARHRLRDADLRAALDRAARTTGRTLSWRTVSGRPVAERTGPAGVPSRDLRVIVMPAPHLVVVTPPAYREVLLHPRRPSLTPDGGAPEGREGGADGGTSETPAMVEPDWTQLVRRLDAQDSIMPADAVAMLHAADVLGRRVEAGGPPAQILGLPVPRVVDVVLGIRDTPFAALTASFAEASQAQAWEAAWPRFHQQLRSNPLLVLAGFAGLLDRLQVERDEARVVVHLTATNDETLRILTFVAAQATAWRLR